MERSAVLHCDLPLDLPGLQAGLVRGEEDCHGAADPLVQAAVTRLASHILAWFLCFTGCQEMVGAVLQVAMARQHCHLPKGTGDRGAGGPGQDGQEDHHQILPSILCALYTTVICPSKEEVPKHAGVGQDWNFTS